MGDFTVTGMCAGCALLRSEDNIEITVFIPELEAWLEERIGCVVRMTLEDVDETITTSGAYPCD